SMVHILPRTIIGAFALRILCHDVGVSTVKPGRNCIRRRPKDDLNASLVESINYPIHPREFKTPVLWLPSGPCGLADSHDGKSGFTHETDVSGQPLVGLIFMVIGHAVKHSQFLMVNPALPTQYVSYDESSYQSSVRARRWR